MLDNARMELSTDKILDAVVALARKAGVPAQGRALDVGSGTGALLAKLRRNLPGIETWACDYTDSLMAGDGQKVDVANLNEDRLPYADNSFDLVTCTEVIEHLENYRRLVRETARVLRPGGSVVFSTPNILNLQSRLRFMWFGFWNLFGPLPIGRAETFSTVGHITPVSYFYLAHAMAEAGLEVTAFQIDKVQRTAVVKLALLAPFIGLFSWLASAREHRRFKTITADNRMIVDAMNSRKMLLGRSIIVMAQKPLEAASYGSAGPAAPAGSPRGPMAGPVPAQRISPST